MAFSEQLFSSGRSTQYEEVHNSESEDRDGLGYYPDGNKRTLTDDQIAMFRHSEIYAILRERQIQKENAEADGDEEVNIPSVTPKKASESAVPFEVEEEAEHATASHNGEHRHLSEHYQADAKTLSATKNKRKRNSADDGGRPYTSRRVARELDSAVDENCVLDYGDQPTEKEAFPHAHPREPDREELENHNTSSQGRKIWWPVILTS